MKRFPYISIILENTDGEVLLLLRENRSTMIYPNHWTLIGGNVKHGETPEVAGARVLKEEIGVETELSLWKRYDRDHPIFIIDQHVFTGRLQDSRNLLVLGRDTQFFKPCEITHLKIGYGFKELLEEHFLVKAR